MNVVEIEVKPRDARDWIVRWLGAGHFISKAVLANAPVGHGHFRTCITKEAASKPLPDFERGWVANSKDVDIWLAGVLDDLTLQGAKCVIVEDDLSSPSNPRLITDPTPTAFIHDRVFSWSDINPGDGLMAIKRVMGVGSGYPRNAFVTTHSAAELGFVHGTQAPEEFPRKVAESLLAVMVAIFDAETFLVWTPDDHDSSDEM